MRPKLNSQLLFLTTLLFFFQSFSIAEEAKSLPVVQLEGDLGGHLDGKAWSSDSLRGKLTFFFYVDPDEKDKNQKFSDALKEQDFPSEKLGYIAMINMAATWMPNFAINSALKSSQKKYPKTLYLKDLNKLFVSKWNLADDDYHILLLGPEGEVLFSHAGLLPDEDFEKVFEIVRKHL